MKALIGRKLGMTQVFDGEGNAKSVTLIEAGPCVVTQVKNMQTDGYNAVQLGFGAAKKLNRPQMGHLKAANVAPEFIKEIRSKAIEASTKGAAEEAAEQSELELKVGDKLDTAVFEIGDKVQITGISKGKGFAGTIKRHNFHRGPKTHGSRNYRRPGSIGSGFPERVFPGQKMAGRMGSDTVTVKNLKVMAIDSEQNLLAVGGAVPGPRKGFVVIEGVVRG